MNGEFRFMADQSLAGLAKWLRLLGYDVTIYSREAGRSMMKKAKEDGRFILTRRQDLAKRQFSGDIICVHEEKKPEQLSLIIKKLSLKISPEKMFTICLSCNERLCKLERIEVHDIVPEYVYETCDNYRKCPKCKRIYWPGTHVQNAMKYLENHGIVV